MLYKITYISKYFLLLIGKQMIINSGPTRFDQMQLATKLGFILYLQSTLKAKSLFSEINICEVYLSKEVDDMSSKHSLYLWP